MPAVRWLRWSAASFARAEAEHKPVLLSIAASWSGSCAEMDRTSYADPEVAAVIRDRFVPIRVDADRRPDIAQRYGLGGWPTTAFLTPDGSLLGGGTYVEANRLLDVLQRVSGAFAAGRHLGAHPDRGPQNVPRTAATIDQLVDAVRASFDPLHGGFGPAPKFPHAAPIRLALDVYTDANAEEWQEMAVRSLDAIGWGALYDEQDGGFFRCSLEADWSRPIREKLLDVNASLLGLYVHAFEALRFTRYAERAEGVLRYVQTWLADPVDGGWSACERQDGSSTRSGSTSDGMLPTPSFDQTLLADWNASMVSAALHAGRVMADTALSEFAVKSLERIILLCYRPGEGVAHYFDSAIEPGATPSRHVGVRGLLDDQIAMAAAHLDAFEATGNVVYEMMAEELVRYAIRTMWDDQDGGFFDRAGDGKQDVGLLRVPLKPYSANCLAAAVLRRLAKASGHTEFADRANRTLATMSPQAAAHGPLAAEYILATRTPVR